MESKSSSTRDRIIDEGMRLFGEQGFKGASVAQIEAAAGLSPGAGGLYHHFGSKEEVLAAGIERHLARLDALRDIRRLIAGVGDLRAELTITARYFLAELDNQAELLRILVSENRSRGHLLTDAVDQLIATTFQSFAEWLQQAAGEALSPARARTVATLALGSLLSSRLLRSVIGVEVYSPPDDELVDAWVEMVTSMIEDGHRGEVRRR
jgi:AcrR family transcriptional regulator